MADLPAIIVPMIWADGARAGTAVSRAVWFSAALRTKRPDQQPPLGEFIMIKLNNWANICKLEKRNLFRKSLFEKRIIRFTSPSPARFMMPVDRYRLGSHPGRRRHLISYRHNSCAKEGRITTTLTPVSVILFYSLSPIGYAVPQVDKKDGRISKNSSYLRIWFEPCGYAAMCADKKLML